MKRFDWGMSRWNAQPLALRLTLLISALIALSVTLVTLLSIRREQQRFRAELEQQAHLLLETLSVAVSDPLYTLDSDSLGELVTAVNNSNAVILARVYGPEGRILADGADPDLRFRMQSDPFGEQLAGSTEPILVWQADRLLAGQPLLIGQQRLGALGFGLSTLRLEHKLAELRYQGLLAALLAALGGAGLAFLFSRSVSGPLRLLTQTARQIAAGELERQVAPLPGAELASLSSAFNTMVLRLRATIEQQQQQHLALRESNQQLQATLGQLRSAQQAQAELEQVVSELSTPVLNIFNHTVLVPLIGGIDSARSAQLMQRMLEAISQQQARVVIIDVTGVPVIDTQVANMLLQAARAARLLGASVIISGIRPEVAQVVVSLGLELDMLSPASDLRAALQRAIVQANGQHN